MKRPCAWFALALVRRARSARRACVFACGFCRRARSARRFVGLPTCPSARGARRQRMLFRGQGLRILLEDHIVHVLGVNRFDQLDPVATIQNVLDVLL